MVAFTISQNLPRPADSHGRT